MPDPIGHELRQYRCWRSWGLHELRRIRAMVRLGSKSHANAHRERKSLQRELATLRKARPIWRKP